MAGQAERPGRRQIVGKMAAAILCILSAVTSFAAEQALLPEKSVGVRDRARPEYDPLGIRMGLFRLSPKLSIGEAYNDNIFASEHQEVSDLITKLDGDFTLRSQGRTPWSLSSGFSAGEYTEYQDENYADWRTGLSVGQGFGSRTQAVLSAAFARNHESKGDPSFPAGAIDRPDFSIRRAEMEIVRTLGIGRLRLNTNFEASDYNDAKGASGIIDQDFRDRSVWNIDLRSDFMLGPRTALFARLQHTQQDYETQDDTSGINRDAATNAIHGGAAIWISDLVRGDIGVSYLKVDNKDPNQDDRSSIGFACDLDFYLTQLLTATLQAQRSSGAADIADSASYVATMAGIKIDYELRRNLILAANYSHSTRDYSGIDGSDTFDIAGISAQWLWNRHIRISFHFDVQSRDYALETTGRSFTQNISSAAVSFTW